MVRARLRASQEALKERGLKTTAQRDDIARVFFSEGGHRSVEELYAAVKKVNARVGYATVYRTLKLPKETRLAAGRRRARPRREERAPPPPRPHHRRARRQDLRVQQGGAGSAAAAHRPLPGI